MRALVLFSVAFAACAAPTPAPPAAGGAPVDVHVARAEMADVASPIEAGGVVRARLTASVSSRVLAPIVEVKVRAGDRVRRGDPLVLLDARELLANKSRASATVTAGQQAIAAAESDVRAAESGLTLAKATYGRIESLHAKRSATSQELDDAAAGLHGAEARLAGAQARLSEARAGLEAARAGADAASVGASYATLSAPFDGVVSERLVDPGSMAAPGVPLLSIEDTSAYRLEVRVDEARAASVRVGDAAGVRIDTATTVVQGRVAEIARLDSAAHSFLVKIDLPGGANVRSGLFGTARFTGPSRRGIAVPATSLVARGQLTFVYAVDSDGTARLRPVSAAAPADDRVELLAGIREGEQVVVAPPPALTDGAHVRTGVR